MYDYNISICIYETNCAEQDHQLDHGGAPPLLGGPPKQGPDCRMALWKSPYASGATVKVQVA